jgi:hypothetical protein
VLEPNWLFADYLPMTYPQPSFSQSVPANKANSITFCSCLPCGTELEQNPTQREIAVMWIKDAAAGAGLIIFMVSSFMLASGAHAVLSVL